MDAVAILYTVQMYRTISGHQQLEKYADSVVKLRAAVETGQKSCRVTCRIVLDIGCSKSFDKIVKFVLLSYCVICQIFKND